LRFVIFIHSERFLPHSISRPLYIGANCSNGDLVKERRMHIAVASMKPVRVSACNAMTEHLQPHPSMSTHDNGVVSFGVIFSPVFAISKTIVSATSHPAQP
jgi:hypothetical protein